MSSQRKNLILWRHAEAQDLLLAGSDFGRALTAKGESQAAVMAGWIKQHLPKDICIIASPAMRAEQTVQALNLPYKINKNLLPEASIDSVLQLVQEIFQQENSNIMLVGHQPWLGQVAAYFLQIQPAEISIKKSAVWWLEQKTSEQKISAQKTATKKIKAQKVFSQQEANDLVDERFKLVAVQSPRFVL